MSHKSGGPDPRSSKSLGHLEPLKKAPQSHKGKEPAYIAGSCSEPSEGNKKNPKVFESLRATLQPLEPRYRGETRDPFESGVLRDGLTAKGRGGNLLNHVLAKVPNEPGEKQLKRLSAFVATSSDPAVSTGFALRGSDTGYLYQIRNRGQGEDLPKYLDERHAALAANVDQSRDEITRLHQESLELLGAFTHVDQLPDALKGKADLLQQRVKQAKDRYEANCALLSDIKLAKTIAAAEAENPIKDKIDPQDILSIHLAQLAPLERADVLTQIYRAPSKSVISRKDPEAETSAGRAGTEPPNCSPREPD
jgi:hypothetical protein